MKKLLLSALLVFAFTNPLFAQSVTLSEVCGNLSSHPNMTGDFVQEKTISQLNRTLKSSGIFIFSEKGIVWNTLKPFPSTMIVELTRVIQIKADGKRNVMDASQNQIFTSISKSLCAMFSGDEKELLENFEVDFKNVNDNWTLFLMPKDKSVSQILKKIEVSGKMQKNETQIDQILMIEANGETIKYNFYGQKFPEELTQNEKSFFESE